MDVAVAEVARKQRNVITYRQLLDAGLTDGAVRHRVRAGWLHRRHRGVYVVGTELLVPGARELSAALACGDEAWVSHRSGGVVFGALEEDAGDVDVTVRGEAARDRPGIKAHRSVCLGPGDIGTYDGIPVTSPARTLLDLATVLTYNDLGWAYNEFLIQELAAPGQVREILTRSHGHPGSRLLNAIVERDVDPRRSKGKLAALVRAALRRGRVEEWVEDELLYRWEVDFYWPQYGLILEADGYQFHKGPEAWRRDRRKQADLESNGLRVLHTDWDEVTKRPESMVARVIRAQLERSRSASPATQAAMQPAAMKASRGSIA